MKCGSKQIKNIAELAVGIKSILSTTLCQPRALGTRLAIAITMPKKKVDTLDLVWYTYYRDVACAALRKRAESINIYFYTLNDYGELV